MPVYTWEGRTRQGTTKKGVMEAANETAVMAQLRSQSVTPIAVRPKAKDLLGGFRIGKGRVSNKELVMFTRQFATMIDAGLPLVQCLDIQAEQQPNRRFKEILRDVKAEVEQGSTFADALKRHPKPFDDLYSNLVSAGEIGGILDTILNRLAVYLEKAESLRRKVKGAMVYPATIVVVAIGVVVLLLVKVIPVFERMFQDFGGQLPGPTQAVVNMSHFMQQYIVFILAAMFGSVFSFFWARRRFRTFRFRTDAIFLKIPVFGSLLRKVAVARFSRTLGTMISSGVPILDALDICARTAGNMVSEQGLQRTRAAIAEGRTIAEPLEAAGVFPGMVVQMISVGEQTGAMDSMLNKIADFYDDEVDAAVDALTALLEPLMMVFLGGTVGGLLMAMYLPIFKLAENIK
jgi:type IV pilus assembly protein PilC